MSMRTPVLGERVEAGAQLVVGDRESRPVFETARAHRWRSLRRDQQQARNTSSREVAELMLLVRPADNRDVGVRLDNQIASSPSSPVRIRITRSIGTAQILPSPIFPVRALSAMSSRTLSTAAVSTRTSIITFGTNSTLYSLPRKASVLPP